MQQRSEETRARILSTAGSLFASRGYDATGVAEICKAAEVSKGAFYHHFHTKQAVFQALLANWLSQLDEQLNLKLSATTDFPTALIAMAEATEPVFAEAKLHTPIILEFWIQAGRHPHLWEEVIAPYRRYLNMFTELFNQAHRDGTLSHSVDPRSSAHIVVALTMGLLFQAFLDPQGQEWEHITRDGLNTIIAGMMGGKL